MASRNTYVGAPGRALPSRRPAGDPVPRLYGYTLPDVASASDDDLLDMAAYAAAGGQDFAAIMGSPDHVFALVHLAVRMEQRVAELERLLIAERSEVLRFRQADVDRCTELASVRQTVMCLWFQLASSGAPLPPLTFVPAPPASETFDDDDVVVSHTMDMPAPLPPPPRPGNKDR